VEVKEKRVLKAILLHMQLETTQVQYIKQNHHLLLRKRLIEKQTVMRRRLETKALHLGTLIHLRILLQVQWWWW
jgi:hypothetical protein